MPIYEVEVYTWIRRHETFYVRHGSKEGAIETAHEIEKDTQESETSRETEYIAREFKPQDYRPEIHALEYVYDSDGDWTGPKLSKALEFAEVDAQYRRENFPTQTELEAAGQLTL